MELVHKPIFATIMVSLQGLLHLPIYEVVIVLNLYCAADDALGLRFTENSKLDYKRE